MKKIFTILLTFLLLVSNLSAVAVGTTYLQPMGNTGGIPMNPTRSVDGKTDVPYGPVFTVSKPGELIEGWGPWLDRWNRDPNRPKFNGVTTGHYTDYEMIAVGGVKDIPVEKNKDYQKSMNLHLEAFCDNDFFFVSQSNPSYKRPFQLYVVPLAMRFQRDRRVVDMDPGWGLDLQRRTCWDRIEPSGYGPVLVLDKDNYTLDINYNDLVESSSIISWSKDLLIPGDKPRLWFDIVLVLPGDIDPNRDILTIDGKEYPLIEADDYSAVVTLKLQSTSSAGKSEEHSIVIPFSGYYSPAGGVLKPDTVSMYVHPSAAAGNLNMKNYGMQQIASLEIMTTSSDMAKTNSYVLFISSNDDPYKKGDKFLLKKENMGYDVKPNSYNSVGYEVVLVDNTDLSKQKIYYGDEALPVDCYPLTADKLSNEVVKKTVVSPEKPMDYKQSHAPNVRTFPYSGTAYIRIKDNSAYMMESGRYTSSIYVHVISVT